jgi:hypothetical protein
MKKGSSFAFVKFDNTESPRKSIEAENDRVYDGRRIRVQIRDLNPPGQFAWKCGIQRHLGGGDGHDNFAMSDLGYALHGDPGGGSLNPSHPYPTIHQDKAGPLEASASVTTTPQPSTPGQQASFVPYPTIPTIRPPPGAIRTTPTLCTTTMGIQRTGTFNRILPRLLLCITRMVWRNLLSPLTLWLSRPNPLAPIRLSNLFTIRLNIVATTLISRATQKHATLPLRLLAILLPWFRGHRPHPFRTLLRLLATPTPNITRCNGRQPAPLPPTSTHLEYICISPHRPRRCLVATRRPLRWLARCLIITNNAIRIGVGVISATTSAIPMAPMQTSLPRRTVTNKA